MAKSHNPPAFSRPASTLKTEYGHETASALPGMSLLDYFAGQALAGLLADSNVQVSEELAKTAYKIAGYMLEARKDLVSY